MNESENLKLVKYMVEEYQKGNFEPIAAALSEDVVIRLTVGEGTPLSGTFRGPMGLAEYFSRNADTVETKAMEVTNFLEGGNQVAVVGRETLVVRRSGRMMKDVDWVMLCSFSGTKISEILIIEDTTEILNAYRVEAL